MSKLTYFVYHRIGADLFLIISTAHLASLWVNNGLPIFRDFPFLSALVLNLFLLVPVFWGFWIYRKLQEIDKKVLYSLDNNMRRSIQDSQKEVNEIAEGFISNNSPYKNIGLHALCWTLWVILTIGFLYIRLTNQ